MSSRETAVFIIAALAVAAFWAGLYLWDRRRRPVATAGAAGLVGDLCRVHALSDDDRAILSRVSGTLPNPAVAFVDPGLLDAFATASPEDAAECRRLRERLFGT